MWIFQACSSELYSLLHLMESSLVFQLEIYGSIIFVSVLLGFIYGGMRLKKIKDCFAVHHYSNEPKNFHDTWKLYFEAPLLSANGICMWRIYCSPCLALGIYIFYDNEVLSFIILQWYIFLFVTDALDGEVARHKQNITSIGKALDPLADKILDLPILFILVIHSNNYYSISLVLFIILFDGIGQIIRGKSCDPSASWVGKVKTIFKVIVIYTFSLNRYDIDIETVNAVLLVITFVFTFWSFYGKLSHKMKYRSMRFLIRFTKSKIGA